MRRRIIALAMPVLLALLIIATPAVAAEPVNVLEVGDYQRSIDASGSATFEWVLYNNDTSPYLVRVTPTVDPQAEEVAASTTQSYATLEPGDQWTVSVTLTSTREAPTQWANVTVVLEIVKLDDPSQVTILEMDASVHVRALFEKSDMIFAWENNLPSPLNTTWGTFAIVLLVWIGIAAFIYFVLNPFILLFTKRTKTDLDDRILRVTKTPIFLLIVTFGLVNSLDILSIPVETHVRIWQAYQIILAINVAWMAYRIFDKVIIHYAEEWALRTDSEVDDVIIPLLHKLGLITIPLVGLIAALGVVGIDLTLVVASMGVLGIVIGLAAQQSLGNFFSGMLLLMDRPFKTGDIIKLDTGEVCRVEKIGLRSTQMYNTFDHDMIVLPNDMVANKKLENYSRPDRRHSQFAEVGVAYGTDLDKVKSILLDIADKHPDVIKEKGQMPYVRMAQFNNSSIDFKLWYWVGLENMWQVASDVRMAIDKRFKEEGIEIPFPQSVVTFKNAPPQGPQ